MAMGRRRKERQQPLFLAASDIRTPGDPFYRALNRLLDEHGFDEEEASKFFLETARKFGRQRRREWWREWWPSVFVAAVILALVQHVFQWMPELVRWIAGR